MPLANEWRPRWIVSLLNSPAETIARASWDKYGAIIIAANLEEAVAFSNRIAPEHMELAVANPFALLPRIRNAGAIFLGHFTPEAAGDYLAGPNHTLPTGGTARFFSPRYRWMISSRSHRLFTLRKKVSGGSGRYRADRRPGGAGGARKVS